MHIAFLSLDYPSAAGSGGVGISVRTLALELVQKGHRVSVVSIQTGKAEKISFTDEGIHIRLFRQGQLHWYLYRIPLAGPCLGLAVRELERSWSGYQLLKQIHSKNRIDVIELTEQGGFFTVLFKFCRVVMRLHGEKYTIFRNMPCFTMPFRVHLSRLLQRFAIRHSDDLAAPSRAHAAEIADEIHLSRAGIHIIPHLLSFPDGKTDTADLPEYIDSSRPFFLFAGRLERSKGILTLLEAAGAVTADIPRFRFVFAGGGHPGLPRSEIDRVVQEKHLEKAVIFLGHVERRMLFSLYSRAWCCIFPSYYESFGMAALESLLMHGCPALVSRTGLFKEIYSPDMERMVFSPGAAGELAAGIRDVVDNRTAFMKMARNIKKAYLAEYRPDELLQKNLSLYQCAVSDINDGTGRT